METGVVRKWISMRGFGFISSDSLGDENVFVSIKSVMRAGLDQLKPGQRVRFEAVPNKFRDDGSLMAHNLEMVE